MTFRLFYMELERRREGRLLTCPTVITADDALGNEIYAFHDIGTSNEELRVVNAGFTFPGYADTRFPEATGG